MTRAPIMRKRMTPAPSTTALWLAVVGPVLLGGCGYIVMPQVRENWAQRLSGMEYNLGVSRQEIDKLATYALDNQLYWADKAAQVDGWPDEDLQDTKMKVRKRTEAQRRFLSEVSRIEDELALLSGEIRGGP